MSDYRWIVLQGSDCNEPKPVYSDLNQRLKEPKLEDLSMHGEPVVFTLLGSQTDPRNPIYHMAISQVIQDQSFLPLL